MAQSIDDGEFWIPPEFFTDDDIHMKGKGNNDPKSEKRGGCGAKGLFPYDLLSGFGSSKFASDLRSPVESLVSLMETEREEEDYITEFTRQMAHSSIKDEIACKSLTFPSDISKGSCLSGSPQLTLCSAGIGCNCRQWSARNCQTRLSTPAEPWDLYCVTQEEVARMRMREESYGYNLGGGFLGKPRKPSHIAVAAKNRNLVCGYNANPSLSHQKPQTPQFQLLKQQQQQMMRQRQQQLVQNKGRACNRGRSICLPPPAWPTLHHVQQQNQRTGTGMRAVFLGNAAAKSERAGTGVFLPRCATTSTTATNETRKKPAMSAVLVPAKVFEALKLDSQACFNHENDAALRVRNSNVYGKQNQSFKAEQAVTNELRLPQEWSY